MASMFSPLGCATCLGVYDVFTEGDCVRCIR